MKRFLKSISAFIKRHFKETNLNVPIRNTVEREDLIKFIRDSKALVPDLDHIDVIDLIGFLAVGITADMVGEYKKQIPNISAHDIIHLIECGVSASIAKENETVLSVDGGILGLQLGKDGMTIQIAKDYLDALPYLESYQIKCLHSCEISPDLAVKYAKFREEFDFKNGYNLDKAIVLFESCISPDLASQYDYVYKHNTLKELVELHKNGVTPRMMRNYLDKFINLSGTKFSANALLLLKETGISPELLEDYLKVYLGYFPIPFKLKKIILFHQFGITPGIATKYKEAISFLDPDEIYDIFKAGISPERVTEYANGCEGIMSGEGLIELNKVGVDPQLAQAYYNSVPWIGCRGIVECYKMGLSPESVAESMRVIKDLMEDSGVKCTPCWLIVKRFHERLAWVCIR